MKIILLEKVNNLGEKFDIVDVKPGYARNFLFPRGLAEKATTINIKWAQEQKEQRIERAEKELEKIKRIASSLDGREIELEVKVGDKGQIFAGVSKAAIAEKLKQEGFEIKQRQIEIPEKIESLGEFPVKINLKHNLEANINLIVKQEESK